MIAHSGRDGQAFSSQPAFNASITKEEGEVYHENTRNVREHGRPSLAFLVTNFEFDQLMNQDLARL